MKPFPDLLVWHDPVARSGPENMAVDELLLREVGSRPILRCYHWDGDWVSVGYFGNAEAARLEYGPEVSVVRRWTGGGVVDHSEDTTYSLIVPRGHEFAKRGREEAYRMIHEAVAAALVDCGARARLVEHDSPTQSTKCFEKPVAWDVVDAAGRKLAGAGQRRTRHGFLHQGSVRVPGGGARAAGFARALPECLAGHPVAWSPPVRLVAEAGELARAKY